MTAGKTASPAYPLGFFMPASKTNECKVLLFVSATTGDNNMLLRNHSARLITVNGIENDVVKSYKVLPGDNPAADVPDKHCKSDFVKNLIKIGDLSVVQPDEQEEDQQDDTESLRTQAKALGIDVDNRWRDKRLQEEIEKASAEKSE